MLGRGKLSAYFRLGRSDSMKGTVVRVFSLILAAGLVACGAANTSTNSGGSNSYQGKTIQFGAILSLTGAGGVYGPSSKNGMMLAVDTINRNGGVNGAKISL